LVSIVTVAGKTRNPTGALGAAGVVGVAGPSGAVVSPAHAATTRRTLSMAKFREIARLRASWLDVIF
jgi:hypothetical protein